MLARIKKLEILPIGLSEVKAHLRLDHAHEDEYLNTLIQAAQGFVEEYLGRSLLTQVWRVVTDKKKSFPPLLSLSSEDFCKVLLPYPPVRTILSVERLMPDGKREPIRRHCLEVNHIIPKLVFVDVCEPVQIDYEAGYGDRPNDIPPMIRHAILLTVADYYEHRDSGTLPRNANIRELLDTFRVVRLS